MIFPFKSSFSSIICPAINLHIWCGDFHWFFSHGFRMIFPLKNPASDRRTRTGPKRSSWSRWGRNFQLFRQGVAQGHWDLYNTEREIYIYIGAVWLSEHFFWLFVTCPWTSSIYHDIYHRPSSEWTGAPPCRKLALELMPLLGCCASKVLVNRWS